MGHGTLVTNIAAGYEGIASQANIGAYRVFGCDGDATDDIIIAAIERAIAEGMDIINLSVSDRSGYPEVRHTWWTTPCWYNLSTAFATLCS
jgi:subtilisin family serine protease